MLQWMGGSRRKVNASRKSTHNKQKQYFEQRKRRQQTHIQESQTDTMKEDNCHEEPRSLDILNLVNLAMIHNQDYAHNVNEISLPASKKKVVYQYPTASGKACCEPERLSMKLSPASGSEHYYGGKMDEIKIPALSGGNNVNYTNFESNEQMEEVQNEAMILDLLIGDAEDIKPKARPAPENHVAFSVEGLGKIGMETPAHSPNVHKRGLPSPPRPSRHVYSSIKCKARPYELRTHDSAMYDMNIERYWNATDFLYDSREDADEISSKKSMKVGGSHVFPDAFADLFDDLNDGIEVFSESRNGSKTYTDCRNMRKQNTVWRNDTFDSKSVPFVSSNPASFEIYKSGISSDYFQFGRTTPKVQNTFEASDYWKFSPSDPFPNISPLEDEINQLSFDWNSDKKANLMPNMKSMFDSWSFPESEDSYDCKSLLSEESCSSTAGGMKAKGNKKDAMNDLPKTLGEKFNSRNISGDEKGYSSIGEALCKNNIEEHNRKGKPDYFASKSSSCVGRDFASRKLDTDCISQAKETVVSADMTSTPSFCFNCDTNATSSLSKPKFEANPFDMSSVPKLVPSIRAKSKSDSDDEPFGSFHFDEPRQSSVSTSCLQRTAVCLSVTKGYSPCFSSAEIQHIPPISDLLGQGNPRNLKKKEYGSTEKPLLSLIEEADCNECSSNHQQSSNQGELFFASKDRNSEEADSFIVLENSAQLKNVSGDKPGRLDGNPCAPSEVGIKESVGDENGIGSVECIQGNHSSTSRQVTLESYVLQFLCVQKVLLEASAKDAQKDAS